MTLKRSSNSKTSFEILHTRNHASGTNLEHYHIECDTEEYVAPASLEDAQRISGTNAHWIYDVKVVIVEVEEDSSVVRGRLDV